MNNEGEELTGFKALWSFILFKLFLLGIVLTLLLALVFIAGGWYGCKTGGGTYDAPTCINPEKVGTCEDITGHTYRVPKNYELPDRSGEVWLPDGTPINLTPK